MKRLAEASAPVPPDIEPGAAVVFDIRGLEGDVPIAQQIRRLVDLGVVVSLCDSDGVMPAFALGRAGALVVVSDGTEQRGAFATVEAALKHGMTMWEGYRHGR